MTKTEAVPKISVRGLCKGFGRKQVLDRVDLGATELVDRFTTALGGFSAERAAADARVP